MRGPDSSFEASYMGIYLVAKQGDLILSRYLLSLVNRKARSVEKNRWSMAGHWRLVDLDYGQNRNFSLLECPYSALA